MPMSSQRLYEITHPEPLGASRRWTLAEVVQHLKRTHAPTWAAEKVKAFKTWRLVALDTKLFGPLEVTRPRDSWRYLKLSPATMPPVVAVHVEDTGEYEIIDGNHRAASASPVVSSVRR